MRKLTLAVLSVLALALSGCDDDGSDDHFDARDASRLLAWIQKYHGGNATYYNGVLAFTFNARSVEWLDIDGAGRKVLEIIKPLESAASNYEVVKMIRITYQTELVDRYNNKLGLKPVLTLVFNMSEAYRYNLNNSYSWDMVNTANIEMLHPAISEVPSDYCKKQGQFATVFCRRY